MKKYIKDKAFRARGSTAKVIDVYCVTCNELVINYQKDGTGRLLRCYLDRIISTTQYGLVEEQNDGGKLTCIKCGTGLGSPMVHVDGRKAIRLRIDKVYKRISKLDEKYK